MRLAVHVSGRRDCETCVNPWKCTFFSAKIMVKIRTAEDRRRTITAGGISMEGLKILVVDDEARMRKLVKDFFGK